MSFAGHRSMNSSLFSERKDSEESVSRLNSPHLGMAVNQLTPTDSRSSLISEKSNNPSNAGPPSVQLKRKLSSHDNEVWDSWLARAHVARKISSVAVLGCILFATFRLTSMNVNDTRSALKRVPNKANAHSSSVAWQSDYAIDSNLVPAHIKGNGISEGVKKIMSMVTMRSKNNEDGGNTRSMWTGGGGVSSSVRAVSRRLMPVEEAEELVMQWQEIKAEALGPDHQVQNLPEILDDSMLDQVNSSRII